MAGASVESYQFVALRSPRGRLGSELDTFNRLRRMCRRFQRQVHLAKMHLSTFRSAMVCQKFWIQSSLESPKHCRMRRKRLPDPRPIPEGVQEPNCIRKK